MSRKSLTLMGSLFPTIAAGSSPQLSPSHLSRWGLVVMLLLAGIGVGTRTANAQESPDSAPEEVLSVIEAIDAAASSANLDALMEFYAPDFSHSDGLTYDSLESALSDLWDQYPGLRYHTELDSWDRTDDGFVTETTTTITGTPMIGGRAFRFNATLSSRQEMVDGQIVDQEILAESSHLTTGESAPMVEVNLPDEVLIGREFPFDVIVLEPLGDRRLLGTAFDEPVNSDGYLNTIPLDLELLSAGGLFKVGEAPTLPGTRWISGVIVREDGITLVTQRMNVTSP